MVINVQAFNATGKDARRIYEELDDFQSRRPIDLIGANRPILFLDEPQKMEGGKTLDSLANFKPLAVLRYSAMHKTAHNKIHRLTRRDGAQPLRLWCGDRRRLCRGRATNPCVSFQLAPA